MKTFGQVAEYDCIYFVTNDTTTCEVSVVSRLVDNINPAVSHHVRLDCGSDIKCYLTKAQLSKTKALYDTNIWVFADDGEAIKFAKELKNKYMDKLRKKIEELTVALENYEHNNVVFC